MNDRLKDLMYEAGYAAPEISGRAKRFAELLIKECQRLNKEQSYELLGVIVDVEEGDGFDDVCLDTVKRVKKYLYNPSLKKHFGVK
jgi:hypothetical protein